MTVEVLTKLPGLTRRRPTRPENGARMAELASRALAASTRAWFTRTCASSCSRLEAEIAWESASDLLRL